MLEQVQANRITATQACSNARTADPLSPARQENGKTDLPITNMSATDITDTARNIAVHIELLKQF